MSPLEMSAPRRMEMGRPTLCERPIGQGVLCPDYSVDTVCQRSLAQFSYDTPYIQMDKTQSMKV